jgi:hypothetical protein
MQSFRSSISNWSINLLAIWSRETIQGKLRRYIWLVSIYLFTRVTGIEYRSGVAKPGSEPRLEESVNGPRS